MKNLPAHDDLSEAGRARFTSRFLFQAAMPQAGKSCCRTVPEEALHPEQRECCAQMAGMQVHFNRVAG